MNKNNRGFFLSETMVVMAIVAIVLVSVFKIFSTTYSKYKESENYDTVNAIIAAASVKKYFLNIGIDNAELLNDSSYVELTNLQAFDTAYYDVLKQTLDIEHIYLIDTTLIFNGTNLNLLNADLRKYIKRFKNSDDRYIFIVTLNNDEYGSATSISLYDVTLVGDIEDEYSVLVPLNGTFTEPGYTNWDGDAPTTTWETPLDTSVEGTYYLIYSFDGYLLRRKVIVKKVLYVFEYKNQEQTLDIDTTGYYKLEAWGASGGDKSTVLGGKGGYSTGIFHLDDTQTLHIHTGGEGTSNCTAVCVGGYNGGGTSTASYHGSGGGATHIATESGLLSSLSGDTSSILLVAGGGGGASNYNATTTNHPGGAGGGYNGIDGDFLAAYSTYNGKGGTQTTAGTCANCASGSFGQGGGRTANGSAGGGGGYYGGACGWGSSGGGGSSYISNDKVSATGNTIPGTESMPTYDGLLTMTGNDGNGYVKVTFLGTSYTSSSSA